MPRNPARGERHGRAKLTVEKVLAIRADGRSVRAVARAFGISRKQVRRILDREQWAHV